MLCRQTFANTFKEPMLRQHWTEKHPKETDILKAFPHLANVATSAKKTEKVDKAAVMAKMGGGSAPGADKSDKDAAPPPAMDTWTRGHVAICTHAKRFAICTHAIGTTSTVRVDRRERSPHGGRGSVQW